MHLAARPFVGRDSDVRRFHHAVDAGVRLVVVEGEAGIGKTRMLDEAVPSLPATPVIMRGTADRDDRVRSVRWLKPSTGTSLSGRRCPMGSVAIET